MTIIAGGTGGFAMPLSPRPRLDAKIAAAASAGTISQADGTALEAAVASIRQSLHTGAPATGGTGSATASGTSFKDRLNSLIDAQVTSGSLSAAQATELKGMFGPGASPNGVAAQNGAAAQAVGAAGQVTGGAHHAHHHHGGGVIGEVLAALEGTQASGSSTAISAATAPSGTTATSGSSVSATSASTVTSTATSAVSGTDLATQQLDRLIGFIEKMRQSIGGSQTYGAASSSSSGSSGTGAAGMLFSGLA